MAMKEKGSPDEDHLCIGKPPESASSDDKCSGESNDNEENYKEGKLDGANLHKTCENDDNSDSTIDREDDYDEDTLYETPLFLRLASEHEGNCELFKDLVDHATKIEIDEVDFAGKTSLLRLAITGCYSCMKYLLDHSANVNHRDYEKSSALMLCARSGHADCLKLLLEKSADVNACDIYMNTALHYSVFFEGFNIHCVQILLDFKSNVNSLNDTNTTPVLQAITSGNPEAVPILVGHGADLTIADDHGLIPIVEAAYNGNLDILELIVHSGISINSRDTYGETALLVASRESHLTCVKFLLENNADVSVVNEHGCSSLMLTSDAEVLKLLQAAGCPPLESPYKDTSDIKLWNICHRMIKSQLLDANLHSNLFCIVPRLPVPNRLKNSLLNNVTLDYKLNTTS